MFGGNSTRAPMQGFAVRARSFLGARQGSAGILFGLAMLPILLAAGAAVDYGRAKYTKTRLQASVDSAALAAMSGKVRGGDASQIASNYVGQAFVNSGLNPAITTSIDNTAGTVTVRATVNQPTSVMKILHMNSVAVSATATAGLGVGGGLPVELVMALDTTGSMSGTKLTTAKSAAAQLVDTVLTMPDGSANPKAKIALVPFSAYVNVGTAYRNASWLTNSTDYTTTGAPTCYDTYPNAVCTATQYVTQTCSDDGAPYDCSYTACTAYDNGTPVNVCESPTSSYTWHGCVGSQDPTADQVDTVTTANPVPALFNYSCASPLMRLTNDAATLKSAISGLSASGFTYIPSGMTWGWRTLSPNPPFADGKAYGAAKKILVLMTDGINTRSAIYPDHEGTDTAAANMKLISVCTAAKNAGAQVYTIAFDVTDTTIKAILEQCASGPPYYYDAQTNAQLEAAFASIGGQLTQLRLVQ